jgi:hypothetical protein
MKCDHTIEGRMLMPQKFIRGVILASSVIATGLFAMPSCQAESVTLRPPIGTALHQAQSLAAHGKYKDAMAKVNEAEAGPNKTQNESRVLS